MDCSKFFEEDLGQQKDVAAPLPPSGSANDGPVTSQRVDLKAAMRRMWIDPEVSGL